MLNEIIGRKVLELWVGEGEEMLFVVTASGILAAATEADCCSETWFADIIGVDAIIGGTVSDISGLEMPGQDEYVEDGRSRQEYDQVFGLQITTDRGRCDIILRNSSNGYYGGTFEGWREINELPDTARQILDDWSA